MGASITKINRVGDTETKGLATGRDHAIMSHWHSEDTEKMLKKELEYVTFTGLL